jgi:hypothetical protein
MSPMTASQTNSVKQYIKYAMIGLVIVLLVLGVFLARDYIALHRAQIISAQKLQLAAMLKNHGPLTASDVTIVRPWMTFAYINKLFNVPPDYLQTSLSISDPSYPRLSLYGYANKEHVNSAVFTNQVEGSLYNYLTANATSSTN